jgi:Mn-dependent DtxR family transcriptional regulator
MAKTKEEKFLLKTYEMTNQNEDIVDGYEVGLAMGCNTKTVANMMKVLQRSNFIKKIEDSMIVLTDNGIELVKSFLEC